MKILCTRDNLANALSLVSGIASRNINLPILNNVLIKAQEQKVDLIATNLEVAITTQLRAKVETTGSFTVPAKTLSDFVNLLSDEKVELTVKENELEVNSGKSSTKIKGTVADEFPVVPSIKEGKGYVIASDVFKKGLDQVGQAAARNDIRPELAGVVCRFNMGGNKGLVMAATDSYRLAEKKLSLEQGEEETEIIVPVRTAQEVNRVLSLNKNNGGEEKNVRIVISDNQIVIRNNDVELVSRLVEGKYPDYTQIIPTNFTVEAEVSTAKLTKEVKAASLFTTIGVNAVNFNLKPTEGVVGVASASAQAGEHKSEISAEVSGDENSILLNHRYVLDGLNNIDTANCKIKVVNGDSPCVFSPVGEEGYLYIVMPIRQ